MKSIPFNSEYKIDENGVVYSKRFNRPLSQHPDKNGYMRVPLAVPDTKRLKSKTKYYRVHRLVAMTYIDNPKNLPLVNHKDNNPSNNNVNNLEWVTYRENTHWILRSNCVCPNCGTRFIPANRNSPT
jgi:hypothetical protein